MVHHSFQRPEGPRLWQHRVTPVLLSGPGKYNEYPKTLLVGPCHASAVASGSRGRVRNFWKQWGRGEHGLAGGALCRRCPREGPEWEKDFPWLPAAGTQKSEGPDYIMPTEPVAYEQASKGKSDVTKMSVPASAFLFQPLRKPPPPTPSHRLQG